MPTISSSGNRAGRPPHQPIITPVSSGASASTASAPRRVPSNPIKSCRRPAPLHVAERRHAQIESEPIALRSEVGGERLRIVVRTFGHNDDRVRLAGGIRLAQPLGQCVRLEIDLGNEHGFAPPARPRLGPP